MIYTFNYLKAKKKFEGGMAEFEKQLHKIWFDLYTREGEDDSSAFEHIFVGEVRKGAATGMCYTLIRSKFDFIQKINSREFIVAFHNWITFYFNEKVGKIDYEGFISNKKNKNEEVSPKSFHF